MDKNNKKEVQVLVAQAASGDKEALEVLIADVQDMVFNLSLRMLGTFADAEDATQDVEKSILAEEFFLTKATELFHMMKPFNDYLNNALADFKMPTR